LRDQNSAYAIQTHGFEMCESTQPIKKFDVTQRPVWRISKIYNAAK